MNKIDGLHHVAIAFIQSPVINDISGKICQGHTGNPGGPYTAGETALVALTCCTN